MLDAFIKKGVRRILEKRSDEHRNKKTEDAITSMVFTPLQFMISDQALACFKAFLPELTKFVGSRTLLSHEIHLWPRYGERTQWCEPDLVAKFDFDIFKPLVLVGEMKWDSQITAAQIEKERYAAAQKYPDARVIVFAVTKNPLKGKHATELGCTITPMTWTDVHRQLTRFVERGGSNGATLLWASLVSKFLNEAEQCIFTGFELKSDDNLEFNFDSLPPANRASVFFEKSRCFSGFQGDYGRLPPLDASVLFFRRSRA